MKAADKTGATHTIVLGESELSSLTVDLKHMKTGKSSSVKIALLHQHL
jgi:histidyl-tRNA synthetase